MQGGKRLDLANAMQVTFFRLQTVTFQFSVELMPKHQECGGVRSVEILF